MVVLQVGGKAGNPPEYLGQGALGVVNFDNPVYAVLERVAEK